MMQSARINRRVTELWPLGDDVEDVADRLWRVWNIVIKRDIVDLHKGIEQGFNVNEWFNSHANAGYDHMRPGYRNSRVVSKKDRMQIIHMAALYKWHEGVEDLLTAGADVNAIDHREKSLTYITTTCLSPLMYACQAGQLPLVRRLVDAGADVNYYDKESQCSPMSLALSYFSFPIIALLRKEGAGISASEAANVSLQDSIQAFNDPSMKVPRGRQLPAAELAERVEEVKEIALTVLRLLFENGSDPNQIQGEGMPAIHTCIQGFTDDLRCLQLLAASGADIESPYEASYTYNYTMLTPLFAAALNKDGAKAVCWLIQQGVDINPMFQPRYRSQLTGQPSSLVMSVLEEEKLAKHALLLIKAGCHITDADFIKIKEYREVTLARSQSFTEMTETVHPELQADVDICNEIIEFVSQTKYLQWMVRSALRYSYGINKPKDIERLPLPGALKKYVMCLDL